MAHEMTIFSFDKVFAIGVSPVSAITAIVTQSWRSVLFGGVVGHILVQIPKWIAAGFFLENPEEDTRTRRNLGKAQTTAWLAVGAGIWVGIELAFALMPPSEKISASVVGWTGGVIGGLIGLLVGILIDRRFFRAFDKDYW